MLGVMNSAEFGDDSGALEPRDAEAALDRCRTLMGQINALQAELAEAAAEAAGLIESTGTLGWGFKSVVHRLSHELHISGREAKHYLDVGEGLPERPTLTKACRDGALGLAAASTITRSTDGHNEELIVQDALELSSSQLARVCSALRRVKAHDAPDEPTTDSFHLALDRRTDRWSFSGTLNATAGAALEQVIAQRRNELSGAGHWATGVEAFIDVFTNGPGTVSDRFVALLNVDVVEFERHLADRDDNCGLPTTGGTGVTTQAGQAVSDEEIDRLFNGVRLRWVIRRDGHPLWVSQQSRTPPNWMRQVLRVDQPECAVDTCGRRAGLHAHHMTHWEDKPETKFQGLALLCGHHHRVLHRQPDYRLRGHPNKERVYVVVDENGDVVHPQPHLRDRGDRPPNVVGPRPPAGETLSQFGLGIIIEHALRAPPAEGRTAQKPG